MFALVKVLALCAFTDSAPPSYTIHVRELTTPERAMRIKLIDSVTVTDAVSEWKLNSSELTKMEAWLARPLAGGKMQILPIDLEGIFQRGVAATNYQLFPGDRLFLQARPSREKQTITHPAISNSDKKTR